MLDKEKTTREKTTEKDSAASLQQAVDYALNRDKTETDVFESGLGCTTQNAFADMCKTKEHWRKTGGVAGYHLVQSFAAGEVTPELAHSIGLALAERILGGKYEAVISTHLNTGHLHNHIVWNSVSLTTGKKYHSNAKSYFRDIRSISDELCQQHHLSIIRTEKSQQGAKHYAEWLAEQNGQPTWRSLIRQDVDEAIAAAFTWRQFCAALESKGYALNFSRKYATLRPLGKERPVRFKTLGASYTPEAITERILYPKRTTPAARSTQALPTARHGKLRTGGKPIKKLHGLIALYYSYLYKMGVLKRKPRYQSRALREDIRKLDRRIQQMQFLAQHKIDSREQLTAYRQPLEAQIAALVKERHGLYRSDKASPQIPLVTVQITALRREAKLCRNIETHSLQMEETLRAVAAEQQLRTMRTHKQSVRQQQNKLEKNRS